MHALEEKGADGHGLLFGAELVRQLALLVEALACEIIINKQIRKKYLKM